MAERRQVFGAPSFRIAPRLQKPAFGVGAHSRLVLCERLVAGSETTAFVGEAVAPPEDGAALILLDERGCRRSVEEGLA